MSNLESQINSNEFIVAALYKFVQLSDYREWVVPLKQCCDAHHIAGTLLLASEGINGTICGQREEIDAVLEFLRRQKAFHDLEVKESIAKAPPFFRMKVKAKREIVSLGIPDVEPYKQTGTFVDARTWNQLLDDPDVIVVDTRNDYEINVGTFPRALNPCTQSFRQFPDFVQAQLSENKKQKIAMFCTGGIRCEKASSWMLDQGFETVYQLHGGILKYLEDVPQEQNRWQGECFVFDQRVSVDESLDKGEHVLCFGCWNPVTSSEQTSPQYEYGVSCPHCYDTLSEEKRAQLRERTRQETLAHARGERHIGKSESELISAREQKKHSRHR